MEICTQNSVRKKLLQHKFRSMEVRTSLLDRVWQQQVAFRNMDLVILYGYGGDHYENKKYYFETSHGKRNVTRRAGR